MVDCHEIGSPAASQHTASLKEIERGRFIVEERGSDSMTSPNRCCTLGIFCLTMGSGLAFTHGLDQINKEAKC